MYTETLVKIFTRDLNKLKQEITLYSKESNLWVLEKSIANTAGNLCLHIVGNLNYYIGSVLGNSGYVRERDLEFSLHGFSKDELIDQIDATIYIIKVILEKLSAKDLKNKYPLEVFKEPITTEYFLVHLTTHLSYHLGQINYHRRLLDV